ncbi:hypothetical protein T440DRAFT_406956 [Plenodomus tracheiphilus IPT5]|uniref:Uncharacterized protein n=1 Tax=Plenodomus tracheiphilus IPT5 TaxID=1408161 RepID=A0A6A7ARD8_9PLEO|nr:hypothetical protein T440DRAFT_406956 [Plenodomus tracheiphilus IPT5]
MIHAQTTPHPPTHLIAPALLTSPQNTTIIQCINLTLPFITSSTPGISGSQSLTLPTVNTTYTILPPRFNGGLHNAPVPQLVHFLSGIVHITLPQEPEGEGLWIVGGKGGLLFAADTTGRGHVTVYPGDEATVGVLAPFQSGVLPRFTIVKEGGCEGVQTFL